MICDTRNLKLENDEEKRILHTYSIADSEQLKLKEQDHILLVIDDLYTERIVP